MGRGLLIPILVAAIVGACAVGVLLSPKSAIAVVVVTGVAVAALFATALTDLKRRLGTEVLANELAPEILRALAEPPVPPEVPAAKLGACPRCAAALEAARGRYDERGCPGRHGALLGLTGSERLFEHAGLDPEIVRALVREQGAAKGPCSSCGAAAREVRLRGVLVDLCLSCGALWLDDGELERLERTDVFFEAEAT